MIKYFKEILFFLKKLETNNYFYRDLKPHNIGMDIIDSKFVFIVLDYDEITLLNNTDDFFNEFKIKGLNPLICSGTYVPCFVIKDYFDMNANWLDKFDKVHVLGLTIIIILIFFVKNKTVDDFCEKMYNTYKYPICVFYYNFLNLFDNIEQNSLLITNINLFEPKFMEITPKKKLFI